MLDLSFVGHQSCQSGINANTDTTINSLDPVDSKGMGFTSRVSDYKPRISTNSDVWDEIGTDWEELNVQDDLFLVANLVNHNV